MSTKISLSNMGGITRLLIYFRFSPNFYSLVSGFGLLTFLWAQQRFGSITLKERLVGSWSRICCHLEFLVLLINLFGVKYNFRYIFRRIILLIFPVSNWKSDSVCQAREMIILFSLATRIVKKANNLFYLNTFQMMVIPA